MAKPQPEVRLRLFAATDPVIECSFVEDDGTGRLVPYDLTGSAIEFYRKARAHDADPAPLYTLANGGIIVADAPGGQALIHVLHTDIAAAGQFRYHVDAVKSGQRTVLAWGPLSIVER